MGVVTVLRALELVDEILFSRSKDTTLVFLHIRCFAVTNVFYIRVVIVAGDCVMLHTSDILHIINRSQIIEHIVVFYFHPCQARRVPTDICLLRAWQGKNIWLLGRGRGLLDSATVPIVVLTWLVDCRKHSP